MLEGSLTWGDPRLYELLVPMLHDVDGSHDHTSAAPPSLTTANSNPNSLPPCSPVDHFSSSDTSPDQEEVENAPEDENLPTRHTHLAMWAGRNAACPVIKSRAPPRPLTEAVKQARKITREQGQEANECLQNTVTMFIADQNAKMEEIVKAHNVKAKQVQSLVVIQMQYRSTRKVQLYNALVSAKAREVNASMWLLFTQYFY